MDLNDIALFVQIVRAGSFAEAGRRLSMPPSTASRRLQELEQRLGTRLMQRSTRRLVLTEAGRRFFAECAGQVDGLIESAKAVADGSSRPAGKVRVAAPADFFGWFSCEHMARFLASQPQVQLEFELDDARVDLLGSGIDVAFRGARTLESGLIARQIGWHRTALVASPRYLSARGTPATPGELARHDCITHPTRDGPRAVWRLEGPTGRTEVEVSGRFQANTVQAQLHAAAAGLGIALLPLTIAGTELRAGRLRQVLPEHALQAIGFYVVYLSRRQIPRAVSTFVDYVAAILSEQARMDALTAYGEQAARPARPRAPARR